MTLKAKKQLIFGIFLFMFVFMIGVLIVNEVTVNNKLKKLKEPKVELVKDSLQVHILDSIHYK